MVHTGLQPEVSEHAFYMFVHLCVHHFCRVQQEQHSQNSEKIWAFLSCTNSKTEAMKQQTPNTVLTNKNSYHKHFTLRIL